MSEKLAMYRVVLLVHLLLLALQVGPAPASAQGETDLEAAARVAVELSALEASSDFNALYDRIHPDAHAVIPRAAAVGWFQNEFAPRGPGVSTVTGVRFVEWTWEVTGQTYPYTAEVSYEQPFADGSVDQDVVRLVLDHNGEWRWFFGRSREFVNEQIARYVQTRSMSRVDVAILDLNAFWTGSFATASQPYAPPLIQAFGDYGTSPCGSFDSRIGPAVYCQANGAIYYSPAYFATFDTVIGDFAWVTVMAHEWGHHVQALQGVPRAAGSAFELQADCLAGSYARDAETRGLLDPGDVAEAIAISDIAGDPEWLPQDIEGAHGTSDDRMSSFMRGFLDGFIGCDFLGSAPGGTGTRQDPPPVTPRQTSDEVDITTYLPRESDVPSDLTATGDSFRTLDEVVVNYTDPVGAERLFLECGWSGNATRSYEGNGDQSGVTSIYTSVHQLSNARNAVRLLDYSVDNQAASTGASELDLPTIGEASRALATDTDVTIYVQLEGVVIRLTVTGWTNDLLSLAASILTSVLSRAA
jgi:hypothetical protein